MTSHDRCPDEETPLLLGKTKTPLPWSQLSLVLTSLLAEPFASAYIFPFINQLIGELGITGGDDRKIGYYAGLIESLFFVTQALTTWQWCRLSDFIGRRPVILTGLLGLTVSTFAFGLSRTLGTLIISRCIAGVLNGNIGVMKSMLGDLTDHTNMAQVFTLVPAIFCIGLTIAPLFGGALAKPQDRWPDVFQGEFWATYPYFLPSLVAGCFTLLTFFICAIFLKESLPSKTGKKPPLDSPANENPPENPPTSDAQPVPMSTILKTYSVMLPIINYGLLGLIDIGIFVLLPLFCSSPIEIGGLGLPPPIIGTFLAVFGIVDGSVQALFCATLIEWLGAKTLFSWAILFFYPAILLFPIMSAVVIAQGTVGPTIGILLVMQLISLVLMDLAFPVIFIFVTRAAPNKQSLGSVNGLSQSLVSTARAIGPALTTSLFAASKQYNILGGNLVYVVLAILTTFLVILSRRLPALKDEE
ncbi:major facilitator superfamily domain-containing protein [Boletus edulis BED1]|uniref:Major facilitator superfamily domain-containing protein n=1 Tax=Boletus edulis BED1 TaxID=1328754 RepID=A0AAD4GGJ0_BOLED|nr:major facilitator superfamily domain-containing protein [Boletus edulis BED1]